MTRRKKPSEEEQNVLIGERIRTARERIGMPQQHIATVMTARHGFKWHQTTVGRVEAGTRALRLTEAASVAEIIGIPLTDLLGEEPTRLERGLAIKELALAAEQIEARIAELQGGRP